MDSASRAKTLSSLAIYFIVVVGVGVLLAPWVAWTGEWLVQHVSWLPWKPNTKFRRYFDRSIQIVAMIGLWPLLRALAVRSWQDAGWGKNRLFAHQLLLGVALAATSSLAAGMLLLNEERPNPFGNWSPEKRLASGTIVALLEETLFRGVLLGALLRVLSPAVAITSLSVFFSAVHFLKPESKLLVKDIHAFSGFEMLPNCFASFQDPDFLPRFINLLIVGAILGWAFWKTRSLAMPIGLHAAWVAATCGRGGQTWIETPILLVTFGFVIWTTKSSGTTDPAQPSASNHHETH